MADAKIYSASIASKDSPETVIVTGESDGASAPRYTMASSFEPLRDFYLEDLATAYGRGIYGMGSVGEVRDMLQAMGIVAQSYGDDLSVPPETEAKALAELKADVLPEGAVR